MSVIKLEIDGMNCGKCVDRVKKAIEKVHGARPVEVVVGRAAVEVESSQTGAQQVIDSVAEAGYPAREVAA